jgi:transcriptional regulator with XRE-family HTH domain
VRDTQIIIDRLREAAALRSVSPNKAFTESGAGKDIIANLQKGHQLPTASKFLDLADYLDCSVDYLLGRTDRPEMYK